MRQTDQQIWKKQDSLNLFQVPTEFIFFKLKAMVASCGVVGCAKNGSNAPKEGCFRLKHKYRWNFTKIVSTEARYMVIKNQLQRFNPISACRKEFNTARLWKSFYFGQTSDSVWTIQPRLGSKFKFWIQKIIGISSPESACEQNATRKDKMKIKLYRMKNTKETKKSFMK